MARPLVSISRLLLVGSLLAPASVNGQTGRPALGRAEVDGVELAYEVEGSGPPLVLIHGWAVHRRYWDGVAELLARHYSVIRYDRRGYGESGGRADLTADPTDLKALLETLGHSRAHIMGHSQGTQVALTFALRYPGMVDGLILFGPAPPAGLVLPPGEGAPPMLEWMAVGRVYGADSLKAAILEWAGESFGDPGMAGRARTLLEPYTGLDLIDPASPSNRVAPGSVEELPKVEAPTLIIHGSREMPALKIAADVLDYGIPDSRRVIVPGGGHAVNWAEPERFTAEVLRFLRLIDERG